MAGGSLLNPRDWGNKAIQLSRVQRQGLPHDLEGSSALASKLSCSEVCTPGMLLPSGGAGAVFPGALPSPPWACQACPGETLALHPPHSAQPCSPRREEEL